MRHTTIVIALCLLLTAGTAYAAGTLQMAPGDLLRVNCGTTMTGMVHPDHAELACGGGHDPQRWHAPTDHEHGDAPPQWIADAGYQVLYSGHDHTLNTSPAENTAKHAAMKGYAATLKGVDLYVRVHIASNVLDRAARYHSYEVFARDPSGAVSHWQGWMDTGDPVANRIPVAAGDPGPRPTVHVVDQQSFAENKRCEQWYVITAPWSWDLGWLICGSTTLFYAGENQFQAQSEWHLTGNLGLTRRLEASWYDTVAGRSHPEGKFWATQFGEFVSGPADPKCTATTTRYGVTYTNTCLEQIIAPTMPQVSFPGNAVQRTFPGSPTLKAPN